MKRSTFNGISEALIFDRTHLGTSYVKERRSVPFVLTIAQKDNRMVFTFLDYPGCFVGEQVEVKKYKVELDLALPPDYREWQDSEGGQWHGINWIAQPYAGKHVFFGLDTVDFEKVSIYAAWPHRELVRGPLEVLNKSAIAKLDAKSQELLKKLFSEMKGAKE